jgi:hypothetical protein
MPTVPQGPYEGAEFFRLNFSREDDDTQTVGPTGQAETYDVLRISIGGNEEIGFYFKFRGDPEQVLKMLEVVHEAAKQQLPRGRYDDLRVRRGKP